MAIFGFYYPRELTNWYVDDWITKVYSPGNVLMLPGWEVTRFTDDTPGRAVPLVRGKARPGQNLTP